MFIFDYKELSWWYWLAIACMLTAGVAGQPEGFLFALVLGALHLIHFAIWGRSIVSFPVQVRFFYLMFLLVIFALPAPARAVVYWFPTVGTWALVVFGFCGMARLVSLLPWNRSEVFSLGLLKRTIFSRPVRGNVMQGLPPSN